MIEKCPVGGTSESGGRLSGSGLKYLFAWSAVTSKLLLLIVKCQCLQIIFKNRLELIPVTITLICILICLWEWKQRWGDHAGSLRIVCDPGHIQSVSFCECNLVHILGNWKFQTSRRKGGHYFLIFLEATRNLSPNSICIPFSRDIGLLVAWFQNLHTCNRREVRK